MRLQKVVKSEGGTVPFNHKEPLSVPTHRVVVVSAKEVPPALLALHSPVRPERCCTCCWAKVCQKQNSARGTHAVKFHRVGVLVESDAFPALATQAIVEVSQSAEGKSLEEAGVTSSTTVVYSTTLFLFMERGQYWFLGKKAS